MLINTKTAANRVHLCVTQFQKVAKKYGIEPIIFPSGGFSKRSSYFYKSEDIDGLCLIFVKRKMAHHET